jgi:hypothetical protein
MAHTVQPVRPGLLDRIREDPYSTMGQASLACLRAYLDGYALAAARIGRTEDLDPRLRRFSEWVAEKLGRQKLSVSGIDMIQLESEDETRALDRYFALWDEYTRTVETGIPEAEPAPSLPHQSFRELLDGMRRRPGMYLGHPSITLLRAFLQGYAAALHGGDGSPGDVPDLDRFSDWLCSKYRVRQGYRWDRLLLFFHRDESKALAEFFTALSEFEAEQGWNH